MRLDDRPAPAPPHARRLALAGLQAGTAAALIIDGVVHWQDAGFYGSVRGALISEAGLFRVQGSLALTLAALILLCPRRVVWATAALVAASALGAVVLYTYLDIGVFAGLPNLDEPAWGPPGKLASAIAEAAGTGLAIAGLRITQRTRRRSGRPGQRTARALARSATRPACHPIPALPPRSTMAANAYQNRPHKPARAYRGRRPARSFLDETAADHDDTP